MAMEMVHYCHITCKCGHEAYVATSRWIHSDEVRRRAKCTVCGKRTVKDVVAVPARTGGYGDGPSQRLAGLKVIRV